MMEQVNLILPQCRGGLDKLLRSLQPYISLTGMKKLDIPGFVNEARDMLKEKIETPLSQVSAVSFKVKGS